MTIALSLAGCSSGRNNADKAVSVSITEANKEIKKEISDLKKGNQELKDTKNSLETQVVDLEKQVKEMSEAKLNTENSKLTVKQELKEDLNGDGDLETLKLECDEYGNDFKLSINNLSIVSRGSNIRGIIQIVDLNRTDKLKEIAIPEIGPSDDLYTHFYRFDKDSIDYLGTFGGNPEGDPSFGGITINGDGTLSSRERGSLLHTWFYKKNFKLLDNFSLAEVKPSNGLYSMGDYKVKVVKSIPIYKPNRKDKLRDLKVGEEVLLKYSDNKEIVVLEINKNELGYITLENFSTIKGTQISTSEVFEGLCMAD